MIRKDILKLAIPNIISNVSIPLLGIVDTALMGRMESPAYIGAIALGGVIFNFIYWGLGFLRMGTTGITAQSFGAKNMEEAFLTLARASAVALLIGSLLVLFNKPIGALSFSLLNGSDEVESLGLEYFHIRILAAPVTIALFAIQGWFLGMQNAIYPMILSVLANVLNIGFSVYFVRYLDLGSAGVAWGTVFAQYIAFVVSLGMMVISYKSYFRYWNVGKLLQLEPLKRFFMVNRDIFIRTLSLILVFSYFTAKSATEGDILLAVNSILLQFFYLMSYAVDGFAYAAEGLVGRFTGAKDKFNLQRSVRQLLIWGAAFGLLFGLAYLFGGRQLLRLFTDKQDLIEAAVPYLVWIAIISPIGAIAFVWDGVFIGATATVSMRNIMLVSSAIFFLVFFASHASLANHALWLAMLVYMLVRAIGQSFYAPKVIGKWE